MTARNLLKAAAACGSDQRCAVLRWLSESIVHHHASAADIAFGTGLALDVTCAALTGLQQSGRVTQLDSGDWWLSMGSSRIGAARNAA